MAHSTTRRRRTTATLFVSAASLAVGLVASPANAAAAWEPIPVPTTYANISLLPFDNQNGYARTQPPCWGGCRAPKLWQQSGNTWKEMQPPADVAFDTLAGTGPNDLWAIGRKDMGERVWHVHRYDGTKWSSDMAPDTRRVEILDAEAVNRSSLWGAGNTRNSDFNPMVTHWDGQKWNTKTFTDIKGGFDAVDVRSENDVWAAGYRSVSDTEASYQPLVMHYDGTKWSEVKFPTSPEKIDVLRSVHSNGPNDVWVASYNHVSHWNGTTWKRVPLPGSGYVTSFATYDGRLYAGVSPDKSGDPKLVRWNGTSWVADTSLADGSSVKELTTTPAGAMYAVVVAGLSGNSIHRLAPPSAG